MKALLFILPVLLTLTVGFAQEAKPGKSEKQIKIPSTLAEAHEELERQLPKEELAKIDAMKTEDEMVHYHFGAGMGMRNSWRLWGGLTTCKTHAVSRFYSC